MWLNILGSFAPAIILTYIIYQIDRHEEPLPKVSVAFLIGVLSPLLTLEIAKYTTAMPQLMDHHPFIRAFLAAALPEEIGRVLLLYYLCQYWKVIDEPFDVVVYASAIWLGFSAIETSLYASLGVGSSMQSIIIMSIRSALCAIGHLSYGIIIGAYLAIAIYADKGFWRWILRGLFISIALHTFYDGLIFSLQDFGGIWKLGAAVIADGLTLIFALLFLMKMSKVQQISRSDEQGSVKQARLIARHAPDHSVTIFELLRHFGLIGLFNVLLVLISTSVVVCSILLLVTQQRFNYLFLLLTGALIFKASWSTLISDTRRLHVKISAEIYKDNQKPQVS